MLQKEASIKIILYLRVSVLFYMFYKLFSFFNRPFVRLSFAFTDTTSFES